MGVIANRVLEDLGYDPNYKIGYTASSVYNTKTPASTSASQGNNFFGNVFNSIRAGVGGAANVIGQFAKKSLYDEPAALGNYLGSRVGATLGAGSRAKNAAENFKMVSSEATKNFRAGKLSQSDYLRILDNAKKQYESQYKGSLEDATAIPRIIGLADQEYNKKALPVALTALSIASPAIKGGSFANSASNLGKEGSVVNKVTKGVGGYVDSTLGTGKTLAGENGIGAFASVAGKVARVPLVVEPTIQGVTDIKKLPEQIKNKDLIGIATGAGSLAIPAVLESGSKGLKIASKALSKNIFTTSGVFDNVILKGGKSVNQELKALSKELNSTNRKYVDRIVGKLRVIQDMALQEAGGNAKLAAYNLGRYQSEASAFKNQDLDGFLKNFTELIAARKAVQKGEFKVGGKIANTVSRFTQEQRAITAERIATAENKLKELTKLQKEGVVVNKNLSEQIKDIINSTDDPRLLKSKINSITAAENMARDAKGNPVVLGNGLFPVFNENAAVINRVKDTAPLKEGTNARLGFIGEALRKAGISPEEVTANDNKLMFAKVREDLINRIDGIKGESGSKLLEKLENLADRKIGVTDLRQLSKKAIENELVVSPQDAKKIVKATKDSYGILGYAERGLGNKIVDANYKYNPLAAPYSRVQSVFRYEKNPFFRIQERIETKTGLKAMGGKIAMPGQDFSKTIETLDKAGILKPGYGMEGVSENFSSIKSNLMLQQKKDIAATIEKFAGGANKVEDWLKNPKNFDLLEDIKTVVQYPDRGFTSSNLAKMMNLVAFPSRYNIKVTQFAVKQLMKQPAAVQTAVIRGLGDFNEFAKSPEGIKWQADNKEVLGLLKYFTPIQPIAQVYQTLSGENKTLGDAGLIGGLPFGFITRVLQGQGIIRNSSPYVDPRTGKVYQDKIPKELKDRALKAISDIVDTMYTYPGRIIGAPQGFSKGDMSDKAAIGLTFGQLGKKINYTYQDNPNPLTPAQQRQVEILTALQKKPSSNITPPAYTLPTTQSIKAPTSIVPVPIYKAKKAKTSKSSKPKNYAKPISTLFR